MIRAPRSAARTARATAPRRCTFHYDTLVCVESACDGPLIACNDDASGYPEGASDLHTGPLPAGTYYVFVDGYDGAIGTAGVTIDATP